MPLSPDRAQWVAWGMTLVLESAGGVVLWPLLRVSPARLRRALWTILAVNALTHPVFWLALRRLPHPGPAAVLVAEAVVTVVEAALYIWLLPLPPGRAAGLSLLLNLLSWLGGALLWPRLF